MNRFWEILGERFNRHITKVELVQAGGQTQVSVHAGAQKVGACTDTYSECMNYLRNLHTSAPEGICKQAFADACKSAGISL